MIISTFSNPVYEGTMNILYDIYEAKKNNCHITLEEAYLPSCKGENSELLFCLGGVNNTAGSNICPGRLLARFPLSGGFGTWDSLTGKSSCGNSTMSSPLNISGTETLAFTAGSSEDERLLVLKGIMSTLRAFRHRHISTEGKITWPLEPSLLVHTLTEQSLTSQAPVVPALGGSGYFGEKHCPWRSALTTEFTSCKLNFRVSHF